ncbi:MAG: hypothetical protein D8G53_11680 [Candidatus Saccharimonas sp.]|nr:MAG: hypothetical protein D8G53_11680 [Candidatus Saccharimonas sp.]
MRASLRGAIITLMATRKNQTVPLSGNIQAFSDAKRFLFDDLPSLGNAVFRGAVGLERARAWLALLGDPQESFPIIHIAGTSGKGSTSYFIANLLKAHGKTNGLHVSPHVFDVRERAQINIELPSEAKFTKATADLIPYVRSMQYTPYGRPTYFEVTNALALRLFEAHHVDYGVIETGLGGRYDSTNTVRRSDKLAVITRLGLDHTEILGNTLEEIAWQKAGIIPYGGTVVALRPEQDSVRAVLEEVAYGRQSQIIWSEPLKYVSLQSRTETGVEFLYRGEPMETQTPGDYQMENAAVALDTVRFLATRDGWDFSFDMARQALLEAELPGRANVWHLDGRNVMVDSAHNPQKIAAFLSELAHRPEWHRPLVIFAAKHGKDWRGSLETIGYLADRVYITQFFRDMPSPHLQNYSVKPEEFAAVISVCNMKNVRQFDTPIDAFNAALQHDRPIVVVGSMYMLGELYEQLCAAGRLGETC